MRKWFWRLGSCVNCRARTEADTHSVTADRSVARRTKDHKAAAGPRQQSAGPHSARGHLMPRRDIRVSSLP